MVSHNIHPLQLASELIIELSELFINENNVAMSLHLVF
jgi:hypothetical protein